MSDLSTSNDAHFFAVNIEWDESNPGAMSSWDVQRCTCSTPWKHERTL